MILPSRSPRLLVAAILLLAAPLRASGPVEQTWQARHSNTQEAHDASVGVGLDASGNMIVVGSAYRAGMKNQDIVAIKYDPEGKELWTARFDGGDYDEARGMAIDPSGAVIITGWHGIATEQSIVMAGITLKYDPDGTLLWKVVEESSWPGAIAVDGLGNIYVVGTRYRGVPSNDFLTMKYDPRGKKLWDRVLVANGSPGVAYAVDIDPEGNVHVAGGSASEAWMGLVVKFDPNGKLLWSTRLEKSRFLHAIMAGGSEGIYVAGSIGDAEGLYTAKLDSGGRLIWEIPEPGWISIALVLASDRSGGILVAGSQDANFVVVKYDRGDCDGDGRVGGSLTDAILILEYNFSETPLALPCIAACDANGDGRLGGEVTDAIYILAFGFLGGPPPPPPFPACGFGSLPQTVVLGCEAKGSCR